MGTRSGDLDPGLIIYLLRNEKLDADKLEALLNHQSGLFALSSGQSDVKTLESQARSGDRGSALALEIFAVSVRKVIGAYVALLGGADVLVFTGGIGEHSEPVRSAATKGLETLGLTADKVQIFPTQEEQQIARHCRTLMAHGHSRDKA
jgi:acetate kinase